MPMVDMVGLTPAQQKAKCHDSLIFWLDQQSKFLSQGQTDRAQDCEATIRFYRERIKGFA